MTSFKTPFQLKYIVFQRNLMRSWYLQKIIIIAENMNKDKFMNLFKNICPNSYNFPFYVFISAVAGRFRIVSIIIIQLMRNNIAFRLSAQNSLNINEVTHREEKNLLNTFKAGSDLRSQLNKVKPATKTFKVGGIDTFSKQQQKADDEVLAQQVAALDHFKAPVTRQKTKNLIENIKLRRRQKHIDALSRFKQDADEYKQTLKDAYQSLTNDIGQVMTIKFSAFDDYLTNCDNKEYLISREKDFVSQIQQLLMNYRVECQEKLNFANDELQRIKNDRSQMSGQICNNLCEALIQIAFILQPQSKQIKQKQHDQLQQTQQQYFNTYKQKLQIIKVQQQKENEKAEIRSKQIIKKWRTIKQEYEIEKYIEDAQSDTYRRNIKLKNIFNKLIDEQYINHDKKIKVLNSLIMEDPDSLSKANIDKFNQVVRKINGGFDQVLDQFLLQFKEGNNDNRKLNQQRLQKCKNRLTYIQNHTTEQIQQIMAQKCLPLCKRNIEQQQQLIKKATNYAQNQDDKQNKIIQTISKFILKIGNQNDNFIKQFATLNQKYQIEKAKILDQDQETVDKLKEQLQVLKKELKEALHHIKLEEVEKKCFQKVDQIQKAYRQCHQKNKSLKQTRTPSLQQFMKKYEAKLAEILELFDPSRRAELQQKNKKQNQQLAQKKIEAQDKKKAEQQLKAAEEAKAKGGKAPPAPKPKDPKKAAAELEERKKAILAEIGTKKIQQIKTDTGSTWLVFKSILEICQSFYRQAQKQIAESKGEQKQEKQVQEEGKVKALDTFEQPIKDCRNNAVVNEKSFIKLAQIVPMIEKLRQKIFDAVSQKKVRIINESQKIDEEMLEQSLINLDNRLKAHYSLKGTIQNQIFVKRSGEITGHKKKYEKYARTIKDKIDLQTEKFNFLLQKGLESLKNHIAQQKGMKEHIPKCKNLSELQGLSSRTRENYNSFGLNIRQIYNQLQRFSTAQIDTLLKKNEEFIKQSRLMKDGGDYSNEQIAWYEQMMNEITTQMKDQQQKRQQKYTQLKQHSEKRKQQLLQAFEKEYNVAVEQLAARDGTGKKYGRPKRIAQQRTRLQMSKCEQAQIKINQLISEVAKQYQNQSKKNFQQINAPLLEAWRKKLMTIQFCIMRYSKHIEALKPDLKINPMIRVTYNLKNPEAKLLPEQQQQDKKRKEEELKALGKLSDQKDERPFMKYVDDIEKVISDESKTIYVGDKAKFLTGNDKIPDFLRTYIANMKKSCQTFRISSVRDLRDSCQRLSDLSANICQLFLSSILSYFSNKQKQVKDKSQSKFKQLQQAHKKLRAENMKKLRPNLSNPKCQDELKDLDKSQIQRNEQYSTNIESLSVQFKDNLFKNAQELLSSLLNNYEFLLLLTDSFYLNEDFIKLPGDEIEEKNHLETHKLMVMKQKGIKIDPSSQRNLRKKWEGLDYSIFNIEHRKYEYKKVQQVPKDKDKKAGKKDTKDPKKQQEAPPESDPSKSKIIQTFKTWRQKSVFEARQRARQSFKAEFDKALGEIISKIEEDKKQNAVHGKKWRQIADSLYLK